MFETKNHQTVCEEFKVNPKEGLSSQEAGERLRIHGFNKLQEKKKKPSILIFFSPYASFRDTIIRCSECARYSSFSQNRSA